MSDEFDELGENDYHISAKSRRTAVRIDKNVVWNNEMLHKLICAVAEYNCLWDVRSSEAKDLKKRTSAWQRIAEDVFDSAISSEQVKKKWQLLLQTHSRKVAEHNGMKSGQAGGKPIVWEFWNPMAFVRQSKTDYTAASVTNLSVPVETILETHSNSSMSITAEDVFAESSPISATQASMRSARRSVRKKRSHTLVDSYNSSSNSTRMNAMSAAIQSSVESISSIASSLDHHDKFDDFGDYMASVLRQMPSDFADKAMAELQYSMSLLNIEASAIRLRLTRLPTAPTVPFESEGIPTVYYLFGEREEPYDATIHREMRVVNGSGYLVKDEYIQHSITAVFHQKLTKPITESKADAAKDSNTATKKLL